MCGLVVKLDLKRRDSTVFWIFDDVLDLEVVVEGASLIDGEGLLVGASPTSDGLGFVPEVGSTWHEGLGPGALGSEVETLTLLEEGAVVGSEVWSVRPVLLDIGGIH